MKNPQKSIFYICIVVCLCFHYRVMAQAPDHRVLVHLDKPYYVNGETIHYKIYFPAILNDSAMVEMAIHNEQGKLMHRSYLKKEGHSINGHYRIPYELESGVYHLLALASVEKEAGTVSLVQVPLSIFNDNDNFEGLGETGETNRHPQTFHGQFELDVKLEINARPVGPRENVELKVVVRDDRGNPLQAGISVSVSDYDLIGAASWNVGSTLFTNTIDPDSSLAWTSHLQVTGNVKSLQEGQLLTFAEGPGNKMYYTTTGSQGFFYLWVPEFFGYKSWKFIPHFSGGNQIELHQSNRHQVGVSRLAFTHEVREYLQKSKQRKAIYPLFNKTERSLSYTPLKSQEISHPDREIQMANYPFNDLQSFCKEFSTPLKYLKEKGETFGFKMFDPESRNLYSGSPLFIVDGQMTKDPDYLSSINLQRIDRIGLYYQLDNLSRNFGFAGFSGVVVITSADGTLQVPHAYPVQEFQISGLQQPPGNWNPTPSVIEKFEPVFSPLLYWDPALETNQEGVAEISFMQSDDISTFQIEVVVQSADGRRGHQRLQYQTIGE